MVNKSLAKYKFIGLKQNCTNILIFRNNKKRYYVKKDLFYKRDRLNKNISEDLRNVYLRTTMHTAD